MSLAHIQQLLKKLELTTKDEESSIGAMQIGKDVVFGDASNETLLIVNLDDADRMLSKIAYANRSISPDMFWSGDWLEGQNFYRGYDELWNKLQSEPHDVSVSIPRSSETLGIGRAKWLSRDWWLFESDNGDYALVPTSDTKRWKMS